MRKEACIIAAGEWGGNRCLIKNRDRNYNPEIEIVHEIVDGIEVLYLRDLVTGWVEGVNEFGIGVVNSALFTRRDEGAKKFVKTKGKVMKDAEQVMQALSCKKFEDAVDVICSYKGGLLGHSLVGSPKSTKRVEVTSKEKCIVKDVKPDEILVRTNHGIEHSQVGYTKGPDKDSSHARFNQTLKVLEDVKKPGDLAPTIYGSRLEDHKDPNNMVRDAKLWTSTQMVMDLTDLVVYIYLIPDKAKYLGYKNKLPKGHKAKLTLNVYLYTDLDKDGKFEATEIEIDKAASSVNAAQKLAEDYFQSGLPFRS